MALFLLIWQRVRGSRMLLCLLLSLALMVAALVVPPGSVVAVTLYKAHLMSLGGWGGYWLDRWLFPYGRPHSYLLDESEGAELLEEEDDVPGLASAYLQVSSTEYPLSMLRRAVIVAACLICVGLGA